MNENEYKSITGEKITVEKIINSDSPPEVKIIALESLKKNMLEKSHKPWNLLSEEIQSKISEIDCHIFKQEVLKEKQRNSWKEAWKEVTKDKRFNGLLFLALSSFLLNPAVPEEDKKYLFIMSGIFALVNIIVYFEELDRIKDSIRTKIKQSTYKGIHNQCHEF